MVLTSRPRPDGAPRRHAGWHHERPRSELQPGLLGPVLVTGAALGGLPLLLIVTLALVFTRVPARQAAAERVLDRLLSTLRPRDPAPHTPRRRSSPPTDPGQTRCSPGVAPERPPQPGLSRTVTDGVAGVS